MPWSVNQRQGSSLAHVRPEFKLYWLYSLPCEEKLLKNKTIDKIIIYINGKVTLMCA